MTSQKASGSAFVAVAVTLLKSPSKTGQEHFNQFAVKSRVQSGCDVFSVLSFYQPESQLILIYPYLGFEESFVSPQERAVCEAPVGGAYHFSAFLVSIAS